MNRSVTRSQAQDATTSGTASRGTVPVPPRVASLRLPLLLSVFLIMAVASGGGLALLDHDVARMWRDQGFERVAAVVVAVMPAVIDGATGEGDLHETLDRLVETGGLYYAFVVDGQGDLVAGSFTAGVAPSTLVPEVVAATTVDGEVVNGRVFRHSARRLGETNLVDLTTPLADGVDLHVGCAAPSLPLGLLAAGVRTAVSGVSAVA